MAGGMSTSVDELVLTALSNYTCSNKGLLLPLISEYTWSVGARAFLYLVAMLWCFVAVAIIADVFMCAIEKITSKTRIVKIADSKSNDGFQEIEVKVWNDTVANLSLMALGTSAPEILLNVTETLGRGFRPGVLGPATIVGSAAFNLLCITAICIIAIPKNETRKIQQINVYAVTSFTCIFAYIWMLIVLMAVSPDVIELWEAIVTFLMFPLLIVVAYFVDKSPWCSRRKTDSTVEIGLNLQSSAGGSSVSVDSAEIRDLAMELTKRPDLTEEDAAKVAAATISSNMSHSSAWYRINARRIIMGSGGLQPQLNDKIKPAFENLSQQSGDQVMSRSSVSGRDLSEGGRKAVLEFTAASCAVLENEGRVRIGVRRYGMVSGPISVRVETIDGTAEAGSDYKPYRDMVKFAANETLREIYIEIIDDDVWEPDEFFFVKLILDPIMNNQAVLGKTAINQITIVNDDEPGKVEFSKPSYLVKESIGKACLNVRRVNGADGKIQVSWRTGDMSAKANRDFAGGEGTVVFEHGETNKDLEITIYHVTRDGDRDDNFLIQLFDPSDGSELGKISRTIVTIVSDDDFNGMVSRITNMAKLNLDSLKLDTATWGEQFYSSFNVNGGDTENATVTDYILHFISFFWKVLFAFVPPPSLLGGWPTLFISLLLIGVLTTIIGDLANIFGCLLGVPDSITAITFVALGTSMPDTFASKTAAIMEKTADSSIGNINGSNSVNVFLGLGLPWLIASIYWQIKGEPFVVKSGSVIFSVILYTCAAVLAMVVLMLRRNMSVFGKAELGGPVLPKYLTAAIIFLLWIFYAVMSSLYALDKIDKIW